MKRRLVIKWGFVAEPELPLSLRASAEEQPPVRWYKLADVGLKDIAAIAALAFTLIASHVSTSNRLTSVEKDAGANHASILALSDRETHIHEELRGQLFSLAIRQPACEAK